MMLYSNCIRLSKEKYDFFFFWQKLKKATTLYNQAFRSKQFDTLMYTSAIIKL